MAERFLEGQFSLIDLYEQMNSMKKLGPLSKVVDLIPGFGNLNIKSSMLDVQQEKIEKWKNAMDSMTKDELTNPEKILNSDRIERISKGSGVLQKDIREMIKQYKLSKKMIKNLKDERGIERMMRKFGAKMPI